MSTSFIRPATLDDCEVIASINNEHIAEGLSSMETEPKSVLHFEKLMKNFNDRELIQCMVLDNEVIGWGIIKRYSDREGYSTACETTIYLRSNQVRKGFGTEMKLSLIEKCKELGYHHLVAKIFSTNIASIAYNRKLGYEVVGVQKEIGNINGKWLDVTIMQLIL
jgi:L-amino acid N-acyltransferase